MLREWRERRRLSQLDLAIQADISTRHLSFVETGRAQPTAPMILRLSEQLDVPLRERNRLLLAGGYAPTYAERGLGRAGTRSRAGGAAAGADIAGAVPGARHRPMLEPDRSQLRRHSVDRRVCAVPARTAGQCAATQPASGRAGAADRQPGPVAGSSVVAGRASLRGDRDPRLAELLAELRDLPGRRPRTAAARGSAGAVAPRGRRRRAQLLQPGRRVETATDITVEELSIESFYPADEATVAAFKG